MRFNPVFSATAMGVLLLLCGAARAGQIIPFVYRDGLIWVKVRTESSATPLNFLLDSGAGRSVLSLEAARKLGVRLGEPEKVQCVGTTALAWRTSGFRASLSDISLGESPLALDLQETSELCHQPIDGLLGQDFLRGRILQIDFKARCLRFLDEADQRNCCAVVALKMHRDAMCVAVSMNGSRSKWTRLDTGCDGALHWVGGGADGIYTRTSVRVGEETITNVLTAMHRSAIFPSEAGLLGNGILSNYRVTIDAVNQRLLLEKS